MNNPLSFYMFMDELFDNRLLREFEDIALVASPDVLFELENTKYTHSQIKEMFPDIDDCPICLEKFIRRGRIFDDPTIIRPNNLFIINDLPQYIIMPCLHVFHSDCIMTHLSNYNRRCPVYRDDPYAKNID